MRNRKTQALLLLTMSASFSLTRANNAGAALRDDVRFDDPERIPYAHGKVGVAAMTVLWAQPLNALARPHRGVSRRRRAWEFVHALLGRCAIILGIVNIFTGMYFLGRELRLIPFNTWAGWAAVSLGAIWLVGAAIQKVLDQSARLNQQHVGRDGAGRLLPAQPSQQSQQASTAAKRGTDSGGMQLEREP